MPSPPSGVGMIYLVVMLTRLRREHATHRLNLGRPLKRILYKWLAAVQPFVDVDGSFVAIMVRMQILLVLVPRRAAAGRDEQHYGGCRDGEMTIKMRAPADQRTSSTRPESGTEFGKFGLNRQAEFQPR
jgi:hypothetical protein